MIIFAIISTMHALPSYRLASMVTATAIVAAAIGITSPKARAEVSLNLQTKYYPATINTNVPMQKQLLNASPISENSEKYIGHTISKINWRFRYREDASGQCRMTSNQTTLNTIVTMPEIYGATDRQPSCAQLSTTANELARTLILNMNEADRRYDNDTNHGRLQGAFLSE